MVGKHIYSIQIFKPSWLCSQFELKFRVMLLILSCVWEGRIATVTYVGVEFTGRLLRLQLGSFANKRI